MCAYDTANVIKMGINLCINRAYSQNYDHKN